MLATLAILFTPPRLAGPPTIRGGGLAATARLYPTRRLVSCYKEREHMISELRV